MQNDTLIELEGWDGKLTITLAGQGKGDHGAYLAEGDIENLIEQPIETFYNSHAFQIGADYGGDRYPARELILTIEVLPTADASVEENLTKLQRALSTKRDARLWFTTGSSRRCLTVRLRQNLRIVVNRDPQRIKYLSVIATLIAPDPFWYEKPKTSEWISTVDTTGGSTATGSVTVHNPTNQDIWLQWVVQAATGAKWTIPDRSWGDDRFGRAIADANRQIVMPALQAGEHLRIDTSDSAKDPQVTSSTDTQIYLRMNGVVFLYPVPARTKKTQIPVAVTKAPAGVGIQVRCPQPWSSAMGNQ
ncbi:phage tail protein [Prescottella agglutinans]|uniref:Phage tail protein n=1 Tax=Prescottella agglutinans TaxID=1644129 RepID=A0ABT6MFY2_9NOCA|nr:phage tail protein [Prescottella agglutinans]MDH6283233.1 hypothetical protein [Prescottella agglutinans]